MNIDLDKYIDRKRPTITIFGKAYDVDNDYKKVLGVFGLIDRLKEDDPDSVKKFLSYALMGGEKAADEILSHAIPFPLFTKLQAAIVAAMTGREMKDIEKAMKQAEQAPSFRPGAGGTGKRV